MFSADSAPRRDLLTHKHHAAWKSARAIKIAPPLGEAKNLVVPCEPVGPRAVCVIQRRECSG